MSVPSASENGGITWGDCYPAGTGESGYIAVHPRDPNIVYVGRGGQLAGRRRRPPALRPPHAPDPAGHGLARGLLRLGRQGPAVPLRLDLPDRLLAPRSRHALRHGEPRLPHAGRGIELGGDQPGPHPAGRDQARGVRRAPRPRTRAAPSTTAPSTPSRSRPRERGVLWAGSDDGLVHVSRDDGADVAERDAARPSRVVADRDDRAVVPRVGHGLPRRHALQDRRLPRLPLQERGLRPDVAAVSPRGSRPARSAG